MSAAHVGSVLFIGAVFAVGLVLLGWWLHGDQPCECDVDNPSNYAEPEERYFGPYRQTAGDRAPFVPSLKLLKSGPSGRVLHKPGCVMLVRAVEADDYDRETMRACAACTGDIDG